MRCDRPERSAGRGPAAQRCRRPGAGAAGRNRLARDGSASWCHLRRHGRRAHCPAAGLAALGQPHSMGERQARHLLAPARSHIRLAPSYLPGHGAPARYPDAQPPAVLPEDGLYLPQSPGYREVPAIQVLCPAGWVGPKLEPDQARNSQRTQRAEHGGWARPNSPGTEYLKQYRNARSCRWWRADQLPTSKAAALGAVSWAKGLVWLTWPYYEMGGCERSRLVIMPV